MSYEFTKLSNVPVVSEFPEGANAVIETNGEIKRCPSSGGGGVELITLTQSGETFIANKNSEEIIALINSGKLPMLIVPPEALVDSGITTVLYMFPFVPDGTAMAGFGIDGFIFESAAVGFASVNSAGVTRIMVGG